MAAYMTVGEITLKSTNVPVETLSVWNQNNIYDNGDITFGVSSTEVKYKYAGLDGTNSSKEPSIATEQWKPAPANRLAMLNPSVGLATKNNEFIEVVFDVINIDTICFFNIEAESIEIQMKDNTTNEVFYDKTGANAFSMVYDELADFADYLFSEQELRDALTDRLTTENLQTIVDSMGEQEIMDRFTANPPIYYDAEVTIKINKPGGIAKCGYLIVGRQKDLGLTLWGNASVGYMSFAKKDRDPYWGSNNLIEGPIADVMSVNCMIDVNTVDIVKNRLKAADGKPVVIFGDESNRINSMTIYGFYLDLDIPLNPSNPIYTLKVESLL